MKCSKKFILFILTIAVSIISSSAVPCTRVLEAQKGYPVLVGRNMDWSGSMPTNIYVYPRGIERNGMTEDNPIIWTSKYGSIVAESYDVFGCDGFNEKGLGTHLLWLAETNYGKRDISLPGLSVVFWAQYYLDNFKTVAEAVNFTEKNAFQILPFYFPTTQKWVNLHLALEDASGDSAIIEYIDGKAHIYHNAKNTVLTNSPTYDKQLLNLQQYAEFGGDKALPGTTNPRDRFVRANFYEKNLPLPNSDKEQMAGLFSVMNNAAEPYGVISPERKEAVITLWTTISDLTHRTYYYKDVSNLSAIWIELDKFDLNENAPVMMLDLVSHPDLSGNVTNAFRPKLMISQFPFLNHQ